jgi:hypothetical protein
MCWTELFRDNCEKPGQVLVVFGCGGGVSRRYTHRIIIAANNFLAQRLLDRASKIEE